MITTFASNSLSAGAIAGSIIGGLFCLLIGAAFIYWGIRIYKEKKYGDFRTKMTFFQEWGHGITIPVGLAITVVGIALIAAPILVH